MKLWFVLFLVHTVWYPDIYCVTETIQQAVDNTVDHAIRTTSNFDVVGSTSIPNAIQPGAAPSKKSVRRSTRLINRLLGRRPKNKHLAKLFKEAEIINKILRNLEKRKVKGKPLSLNQVKRFISKRVQRFCKPPKIVCDKKAVYRTVDGTCNNLKKKYMGAIGTPLARWIPAVYGDRWNWGIEPKVKGDGGNKLKSAREISNAVFHSETTSPKSEKHNILLVHYAQWLDHDLSLTPIITEHDGSAILCCDGDVTKDRQECFSIKTPPQDFKFQCMDFVRSRSACAIAKREQMNDITAWTDLSNVYGSDKETQDSLRAGNGKLKVGTNDLLPDDNTQTCGNNLQCFKAGDQRNSETSLLTLMHTIFVRQHNRIAENLSNKGWNSEKIFQESKKTLTAIHQKIIYDEFLPELLGSDYSKSQGLSSSSTGLTKIYNPSLDASIHNAFATAVYRFGHSMVSNDIGASNSSYDEQTNSLLKDTFFNTEFIRDVSQYGPLRMGRWMSATCGRNVDRFMSSQLRNSLFEGGLKEGLDLAALNIQRGRDHGLPSYNAFRKFCDLSQATKFSTGNDGFSDHTGDTVRKLKIAYNHPDDVELFAGGISEKPADKNTILGPLFRCLLAKQFYLLKHGDRFFYQNNFPKPWFTEEQVKDIQQQSFAGIFCKTLGITSIQRNIFQNPLRSKKSKV